MKSRFSVSAVALGLTIAVSCWAPNALAAHGRIAGSASVTDLGQASYSIPLNLPPGTNGMAPRLALNYNSGGANGLFGVGWSLSGLSGIARCNSTWTQDGVVRNVRNDLNDRFCLDGKKLRLVTGVYGAPGSTYATEIETFAKITANGTAGNGPASFTVETKDGLIYEYGGSPECGVESVGQSTIRFWAVRSIRDRVNVTDGNSILFSYFKDTTNGSFRILTIRYAAHGTPIVIPPYTVTFSYEPLPLGEVDSLYSG